MANGKAGGLLDIEPTELAAFERIAPTAAQQPFRSPLETGYTMEPRPGVVPSQRVSQPMGEVTPRPGMPGDMNRLNQVYGLLAQYADDPTQVGLQYARALQQQQEAAYEQSPQGRMDQFLGMMGNINPHDITPESIQNFYDNFMQGNVNFDLLEYRKELSDKETQMIVDAENSALQSEMNMVRAGDLATQYDNLYAQGATAGVIKDLQRWVARMAGREGEDELIYREFNDLRNSSVIQNLPPGVASDRDIQIAMEGWPGPTANPAHVAAFLRGRQKMLALQHAFDTHKAYWISENRSVEGRLADWTRNRENLAYRALQRFGGVYNPTDAQGNPMTPEQAAQAYYGPRVPQLPTIVPEPGARGATQPPTRVQRAPPERQQRSDEDILRQYGLQ